MRLTRAQRYASAASLLAPLVVLACIWLPEIAHYRVDVVDVDAATIARARTEPANEVLAELDDMRLGVVSRASPAESRSAANGLLDGTLRLGSREPIPVTLPFSRSDLRARGLAYATFAIPQILLDAYRDSGDERYFEAAKSAILEFGRHEDAAWLDEGFMWNDHAVAARVSVLGMFWRMYRSRSDFDPAVARAVLRMAARNAALLARSDHFTVATNHGVMQNLALLHVALAFPALADVARWRDLALARLREQMAFYVDDEGVVLEHSAGYQLMGVELVGMALRYLTLSGMPIPGEWTDKYRNAQRFYAELRRPDGTLPRYGDTESGPTSPLVTNVDANARASPLEHRSDWRPPVALWMNPVAGNLVYWTGLAQWPQSDALSQTVVVWSYFPGQGHKLADETSVNLWAHGRSWIVNSGYWPYDAPGRRAAEGWDGSNAPHLVTEPRTSERETTLRRVAAGDDYVFVDLVRSGPDGYVARRQLLQVGDEWLVHDEVRDRTPRASTTIWTFDPPLAVHDMQRPNTFRVTARGDDTAMLVQFAAKPGASIRRVRGSSDPFAGWTTVDSAAQPADAIVVDSPSQGAWTIAAMRLASASGEADAAPLEFVDRRDAEHWSVRMPRAGGAIVVQRDADSLVVHDERGAADIVRATLAAPPDASAQVAAIRGAFETARARYPRYRELFAYRLRLTYALALVACIQLAAFVFARRAYASSGGRLALAIAAAWLGVGIWATLIYLA